MKATKWAGPVLVIGVTAASSAYADDFTISVAATATNNRETVDGNDSLTVTATGSVTTIGSAGYGLSGFGDNNALINNGTVSTNGLTSYGILAFGNANSSTNSGTLTTDGESGYGLYAEGNTNTVTNNGTVTTIRDIGYGLYASGNTNTLINNGTISTTGNFGLGIYATGDTNAITNSGTIRTNGSYSSGVGVGGSFNSLINSGTVTTIGDFSFGLAVTGVSNNILNNSGTVTTDGELAIGLRAQSNETVVTNSGLVTTSGSLANGIYAFGTANTVTNSGTVISNQSASIYMSGADATVNLLEGSVLFGDLGFGIAGSATATLNFGAGLNASVQTNNTIPNTITVANGSYVVAGSTIHAVDANSFAASDQTTGVMGGMILDTLDTQVAGNPVAVTRGASAGDAGWVEGFGGQRRHDGNSTTMAFTSETYGVMAGRSLDATSGLFVGAARNTTASDRTFDNRSDSVFLGYYSRYDLGGIEMDASLTFGAAQNNTSRRIANNTVVTGLETARGEYMSYFLMPSATFRGDWTLGGTGFETSVRVRYTANRDQGYTETGASTPMTVAGRTSHLGEVRLQIDGALMDQETSGGSFVANLRLGADAQYFEADRVQASIAGQSLSFAPHADEVSSRAFIGLNAQFTTADGTQDLRGGFEIGRGQSSLDDVKASLRWQMWF